MIGRLYFKAKKVVGNHDNSRRYLSYMIKQEERYWTTSTNNITSITKEHSMQQQVELKDEAKKGNELSNRSTEA